MSKYFLSVVFCSTSHHQSTLLGETISHSPQLKVFHPTDIEEVQQIVNMSERSTLIFDKPEIVGIDIQNGPDYLRGLFRKYYLDWSVPSGGLADTSLGPDGVTNIKTQSILHVIEKLELYLFGAAGVYLKPSFNEPEFTKNLGTSFYTHLHLAGNEWKILLSNHERQWNISATLGRDWEEILRDATQNASTMDKPREEVLTKPFYQMIYPHRFEGKVTRLSIVHVVYNSTVQGTLNKFHRFLEKL